MSAIDEDDAKLAAATSIQKDGLKSRSCLCRFFVGNARTAITNEAQSFGEWVSFIDGSCLVFRRTLTGEHT
jgi:hypothetical protein